MTKIEPRLDIFDTSRSILPGLVATITFADKNLRVIVYKNYGESVLSNIMIPLDALKKFLSENDKKK